MRTFTTYLLLGLLALCAGACDRTSKEQDQKKPNVLFIAVDDLRLQANLYGQEQMKTPNIDRLGDSGVVFNKAYCSVPVCGASRASLLSGARPTPTRFVNYYTRKDTDFPDHPSLPGWFKENGYTTISNGKIYHHKEDDLQAWSEEPFLPTSGIGWQGYLSGESKTIIEKNGINQDSALAVVVKRNYFTTEVDVVKGPAYEAADVEDNGYPDGKLTDKTISDLRRLSKEDNPFFLAVGFWKPHLPFNAPKKYWDMYGPDDIKLPDNPYQPNDAPDDAMHAWGELRSMYDNISQQGTLPDSIARNLIHGYYACVSYVDVQIGKLLDELHNLGLDENTVVVLWGDHGWHLGEHTLWCKHCNFDRVMNAPLIVSAPGLEKGKTTMAITELIDIYPSLCELCNLPKPGHLDGTSFVPVLKDPASKVKEAAFVRFFDAESVITERYNYTEFSDTTGKVKSNMLYDLKLDPKENNNISLKDENKQLVEELSQLLSQVKKTKN